MFQYIDKERAKEAVAEINRLGAKAEAKRKAAEDLLDDCKMTQEVKKSRINDLMRFGVSDGLDDRLWDLWKTFGVIRDLKEKKPVSEEDRKKYGKMTEDRKFTEQAAYSSIFGAEVIGAYAPKPIDIVMWGNRIGYEFNYEIGGKTVTLHVPVRYYKDEQNNQVIEDGKFMFGWRDSEYSEQWLRASYLESEVRDFATDWIKKNCALPDAKKE